jgi:hypothetical protein
MTFSSQANRGTTMRLPRVELTVERTVVALSLIPVGVLAVGVLAGTSAELAEVAAMAFGLTYAAAVGFCSILATRYPQAQQRRPC